MVFEEARVLIRNSIICFATPLNENLDLLGLCFIIAMILGCCLNFSMIFSIGSWICSTLTNRSSLQCKPRDGTKFYEGCMSNITTIFFFLSLFQWKKPQLLVVLNQFGGGLLVSIREDKVYLPL